MILYFLSKDKDWNGIIIFNSNKTKFMVIVRDHLLSMTKYEQTILNESVENIDDILTFQTRS